MLAAFCNNDEQQKTSIIFGSVTSNRSEGGLISDTTSLISSTSNDGCADTCSFLSEPSDATILAFGESHGEASFTSYGSGESTGSLAYSGGGESCGSIATSVSTSSSFSGGGCSYSC